MSLDSMMDQGITGIILPSDEIIGTDEVRSFNYNQYVNALRFSFETTTHRPTGVDSLSGTVRGVESTPGRVVVIAHKFFRYRDQLYVQDCDIKVLSR